MYCDNCTINFTLDSFIEHLANSKCYEHMRKQYGFKYVWNQFKMKLANEYYSSEEIDQICSLLENFTL